MNISVFGSGYVGLVTGACFAEMGNQVVCVDKDAGKIAGLRQGRMPIHEPGLEDLVKRNVREGRLRFTVSTADGIAASSVYFIAVGTPPNEDGSADLRNVLAVAQEIGRLIGAPCTIVDKSTVPVGTADRVVETVQAELARRGVAVEFDVVSNPEFLKEGDAIGDFMKPDRVIVGTDERARRGADAAALCAIHPQSRAHAGDGRARRRADQVRGELDAGGAHLVHERDRDPVRADRRGRRERAQGASAPIPASATRSSTPAAATADRASRRTCARSCTRRASTAWTRSF